MYLSSLIMTGQRLQRLLLPELPRRWSGWRSAGRRAKRWDWCGRSDAFINLTEPFKIAKDEARREELSAILYQCIEALRIASLLLWPVLPEKMEHLWSELGMEVDPSCGGLDELAVWGGLAPGTTIAKVALFPRMEQPEGLAVGGGA